MSFCLDGDKETFERRKEQLLFESKTKEATARELIIGKDRIFKRFRKFFELAKSLVKYYETGILEEQRQLVEIVTSNLEVEGKKLMISMRSPFLELAQRRFLQLGPPSWIRM